MSSRESTRNDAQDLGSAADQARAREVNQALSRSKLREDIKGAMSGKLEAQDIAVMVGLGLVTAMPTNPTSIPPELRQIAKGAVMMREMLVSQTGAGSVEVPVSNVLEVVAQKNPDLGWLTSLAGQHAGVMQMLDFEDSADSLGMKVLSNLWCKRRKWEPESQVYHEAKALSYAVNASVSAFFNPNPISFGLAAWHGYQAILASRRVTDQLQQLVDMAIRTADASMKSYDQEVALTERSKLTMPKRRPFGELDDLDDIFSSKRRH